MTTVVMCFFLPEDSAGLSQSHFHQIPLKSKLVANSTPKHTKYASLVKSTALQMVFANDLLVQLVIKSKEQHVSKMLISGEVYPLPTLGFQDV